MKVVAGSLGVPLGELTRRDKAMQLRKARRRARALKLWLAAVGVLAMAAVTAGVFAVVKARAEREQRELVQRQEAAAHESASAADFSVADLRMKQGDAAGALPYLADALRQDPGNEAATALTVAILRANPFLPITLKHDAPVTAASFSPDSKQVLTTSGSVARVWDARSGKAVGSPMPTASNIEAAEFTSGPNGTIAIQERNGASWSAQIWDIRTGKTAGPQARGNDSSTTGSVSPDGKRAMKISHGGAQIWDMSTGKPAGKPLWDGLRASTIPAHRAALVRTGSAR